MYIYYIYIIYIHILYTFSFTLQNIHQRRGLLKNQSNIQYGVFRKNSQRPSAVNYFGKKIHLRSLPTLLILVIK